MPPRPMVEIPAVNSFVDPAIISDPPFLPPNPGFLAPPPGLYGYPFGPAGMPLGRVDPAVNSLNVPMRFGGEMRDDMRYGFGPAGQPMELGRAGMREFPMGWGGMVEMGNRMVEMGGKEGEEGKEKGVFNIDNINLIADILHYSIKGVEIPYIRGLIGTGIPSETSKQCVRRLVLGALGKK